MLLEKLPDLSLTDMSGNPFSLKELQGKKTLIFMWASW
ncbi:hypothetical protein CU633_11250 [Bacillus sp. V3-13]|nr:hypothetical protein CU633_11250 [Bacillus sp. V3-13]